MIAHAALSVVQEWAATEPLYWACFRGSRPALATLFRLWALATKVLPPSLIDSDRDLGNYAHPMLKRILCLIMTQDWNSDADDLVEYEPVGLFSDVEYIN